MHFCCVISSQSGTYCNINQYVWRGMTAKSGLCLCPALAYSGFVLKASDVSTVANMVNNCFASGVSTPPGLRVCTGFVPRRRHKPEGCCAASICLKREQASVTCGEERCNMSV